MGFFDSIVDAFRDNTDICPNCKKPWGKSNYMCDKCGYYEKLIVCPRCAQIVYPDVLFHCDYNKMLQKTSANKARVCHADCWCLVPYVRIDMDHIGFSKLLKEIENGIDESLKISKLVYHTAHRYIYEHYFDDSQLDRDNPDFQERYACMYPESEESKAWFDKHGTTYEEKFYPKYYETEVLTYDKKQFTIPTPTGPVTLTLPPKYKYADVKLPSTSNVPKCPICGSTNLSKISTLTKAAKISAFGIYGTGDVGKTYKCNHCGVRF